MTHLLQNKSQVCSIIAYFFNMVHVHFHTDIKTVRSDNGTEFINRECSSLFNSKGIIHQTSIVGTPQQNGVVERKHRHLLETTRAIRFHGSLPKKFWGECILAATHLINLMPSYAHLRVIGCLCFAHIKSSDKFEPRARKFILLGYPFGQKGYKLFDINSS